MVKESEKIVWHSSVPAQRSPCAAVYSHSGLCDGSAQTPRTTNKPKAGKSLNEEHTKHHNTNPIATTMIGQTTNHSLLIALLVLSSFLSTACGFSARQTLQFRRTTSPISSHPLLLEEDSSIESETTTGQPLTQGNGDLPTVIQQIADERQEFNMNLGKAMDTLRKDMPDILRSPPGKSESRKVYFCCYFLVSHSFSLYRL